MGKKEEESQNKRIIERREYSIDINTKVSSNHLEHNYSSVSPEFFVFFSRPSSPTFSILPLRKLASKRRAAEDFVLYSPSCIRSYCVTWRKKSTHPWPCRYDVCWTLINIYWVEWWAYWAAIYKHPVLIFLLCVLENKRLMDALVIFIRLQGRREGGREGGKGDTYGWRWRWIHLLSWAQTMNEWQRRTQAPSVPSENLEIKVRKEKTRHTNETDRIQSNGIFKHK